MKILRSRYPVFFSLVILCLLFVSCHQITSIPVAQLDQTPTRYSLETPTLTPSQTITAIPAVTSTPTFIATSSPVPAIEANWLNLPAPAISAKNIDHIQFQTRLGLAGLTALSPDNKYIALINRQRIALYNFKNLLEIGLQPDESKMAKEVEKQVEFTAIAFSPDSTMLVATYNTVLGGGIWIWQTTDGKLLYSSSDRVGWTYSLAFSPDGTMLALGNDAYIVLFDMQQLEPVRSWNAHTWIVDDLAFSPDGKVLATVSRDNSFDLWNVSDGSKIHESFGTKDIDWLITGLLVVTFSPSGSYVAVGSGYGFIQLYQIDDKGNILATKEWKADERGSVNDLTFSPDETMLVSASFGGIEFWSLPDCVSLKKLKNAGGPLIFSSDGTLLLAGNQFWTVK